MLLLQKINELGTTVLIVTHEKELVNAFDKRVIKLEAGRVISDGEGGTTVKHNRIGYLIGEGFRGIFTHGFMSFAASSSLSPACSSWVPSRCSR
jgi:ABC-type phosphate/phosphonate transport system ATPase subunit